MIDTVYMLGAGTNQAIKAFDYVPVLSPPLNNNFFQVAHHLHNGLFANELANELQPVYNYIKNFWKKSKSELSAAYYDIEECFSLLQLQIRDAKKINNNNIRIQILNDIQLRLKSFFSQVLLEFEAYEKASKVFKRFGQILYDEKPTIITFNYDLFIESVIEIASGINASETDTRKKFEVMDEELGHSYWNWNRPLSYGIRFDEVLLHDGAPGNRKKYLDANRFYSHPKNSMYPWSILKLHGSLNWFRYLPYSPNPSLKNHDIKSIYNEKKSHIVIGQHSWIGMYLPHINNLYIDPIIITPAIHKDDFMNDPIYDRIFTQLWKKAKEALCNCRRLILIGYSFSHSDFLTTKLFLESFSQNSLEELIVVNPDTSIVQKVRNLCHYDKPTLVCKDLEEFIKS